jgi:tetratricopeptide (TPR) repeat protein
MNKKSLLELYEQGLLSETESQAFLHLVAQHRERERLREILNQPQPVLMVRRIQWAAAASILIVAISWWVLGSNHTKSIPPLTPQGAFAQVPSPTLPSGPLLGVHEVTLEKAIQLFNDAYAQKKYADCIQLESALSAAHFDLQLLLSYCYLQTGNYSKSIALLEKWYANPDVPKEEIRWWLGLSYGLAGDSAKMKQYLKDIAPKQLYYQEAQALIGNL